jgi:protein-tyrosine-phosphatase
MTAITADTRRRTYWVAGGLLALAFSYAVYPTVAGAIPARRRLLFVCGSNTGRSPMAAAIARTQVDPGTQVTSAGLAAVPGAPMEPEAAQALEDLGISAGAHRSRQLTPRMINQATTVYCMTAHQRDLVRQLATRDSTHITCLDPNGDIPDPHGKAPAGRSSAFYRCAAHLQAIINLRLSEPFMTAHTAHLGTRPKPPTPNS